MTEEFTYNTTAGITPQIEAPIWPQFSPNSEMSRLMMAAKQTNGPEYWPTMRKVFASDLATLPKERFKVWVSVLTVPFMTRFRFMEYISAVCQMCERDFAFAKAIMEPMVGCTQEDYTRQLAVFDDYQITMNRIQHAAHLVLGNFTPERLSRMNTIVEIGAGIGDMTDIIYKLGFNGQYIIYDLPEVLELQRYYHQKLGHKNVLYTSDPKDLVASDLLIGTWSFSEMPIAERAPVLERVKGTKNWLLAYSNKIFGIDNAAYVNDILLPYMKDERPEGLEVSFKDIPFMSWDGGARYLFAKEPLRYT